ncbi:hypothetical protein SteCoe_22365 [Stentor coeruleus]|uniref:Uncharacterized protein n=1 Tax=Stentor coeruleus TaxID=5963 RepID=A0A1R2BMF0_9CILI|nr:hypothetical protein SteCoe_22365 [Stentor coeruleus]
MEKLVRKTEGPAILSPKPMRIAESIQRPRITNPFDTIGLLQRWEETNCSKNQEEVGLLELTNNLMTIEKTNSMYNTPRSYSCDQENEILHSEISCILNSPNSFPISKSLPSPLFSRFSERPPTRHRINPIIYDEKFLKFESSSTTSEEL